MPIKPLRIELPLGIMFQTVNCYLIPGEQLTLIDCGFYTPQNWNLFQEKIKAVGYQVSDIEQVIITHEHRDHIGMLPLIMEHAKAVIRVPKLIEDWFTRPKAIQERNQQFSIELFSTLGLPEELLNRSFQYLDHVGAVDVQSEMSRFEFFEAGDLFNFGETEWEVLNTPGHCLSQMIFIQKEQNWALSSDMLLPIAPMPIIEPKPNQPNQHTRALKNLLNSFERLKILDIQLAFPGHGAPFTHVNEVIDQQLARIQMRKEECFETIKSGAKTPFQIRQKMYPYQKTPPDFSGLFMILGYVDLLQEEDRISKQYDENGSLVFTVNHP